MVGHSPLAAANVQHYNGGECARGERRPENAGADLEHVEAEVAKWG